MPLFIQYLIKFSVSLALVYLFYQLFLRRLTFYNYNRWYLLGYLLLSFIIPFINIDPLVEKGNSGPIRIIHYIPAFDKYTVPSINWWNIVLLVFVTGSLCMIVRLCVQIFSLRKMKMSATKINQSSISVYHVEKSIIPFSFGNNIYINRNMHSEKELDDIVLHEFVHVKQKHTVDILFAEFLCIFNWYNPFAWLLRKAIRQNLEFIADNKVLQTGMDKKNYQYHLLKVIGMPQYSIASNFNFSSLKKRIAMMNKMKSAKVHMLRFLFLLPVSAVILLAFRSRQIHASQMDKAVLTQTKFQTDSIPSAKNDSIDNIVSIYQHDSLVTVKLKNGKTESYDLSNDSERKEYERKYHDSFAAREKYMKSLLENARKSELQQLQSMSAESLLELQKLQNGSELKLLEKNARQQLLEKELLEKISKNSDEYLQNTNDNLDYLLKLSRDSLRNQLLDENQLLRNKLLLQSELDFLNKDHQPLKTADKETLKRLKEEIRMQQIELQKNMKDLQLKEQEIEKQLKRLNDKVSYYDGNRNSSNPIQDVKYIDNVSTQNNMMQWSLEKDFPKHPLLLIDGKPVGKDENMAHIDPAETLVTEFVSKGEMLKNYDEAGKDGLINIVTKANGDKPAAHILDTKNSYSPEELQTQSATSSLLNKLYIGKENPLKIVSNINEKELEVRMDNGIIKKRNGLYYAWPSSIGNVEIKIYRKAADGNLKLLNSRFFRVENLSEPQTLSNNS